MSRSTISRIKDAALQKAILMMLRPRLERYGEIRNFSLDTSARRLSAELILLGDSSPLIISEAQYRVEKKADETILIFHSMKVSKEWVQNLLDDHFPELPVKIPDFVRPLID